MERPDTEPQPEDPILVALKTLADGGRLGDDLTERAFARLMAGEATEAQAAALLMGLRVQSEGGDELAGAARALRAVMVRVTPPPGPDPVDTCGTGGGTVSTFNVSTAAAFVAVGAGARVAKHGNRSYTSRCGSADLLEALGVEITVDPARVAELLADTGLAFLFAPAFHPAMRFVAPVRRDLKIPTLMNLVGPLANPASVRRQVIGVSDHARAPIVADALQRLGVDHALVVHGMVGMDEVSPTGPTDVWEVRGGELSKWTLDPAAYGFSGIDVSALQGGEPPENAERVSRLFEQPGNDPAGRAAVSLNAGAALYVAGLADSVKTGVERAENSLAEGRAAEVLAAVKATASPRP
jgi:anthranilate phosphoribosyltransferase